MTIINEDPDTVDELRAAIRGRSMPAAGGYLAGRLAAQIQATSERHGERCDGCETCKDLARLLSGVTVQREHLMPEGAPPTRLRILLLRLLRWLVTPVGTR